MTDVTCTSCKNQVSLADLKADKSGVGWVCLKCYEHQHPEIYKKESGKETTNQKDVKKISPFQIKYYCTECGYKFIKNEVYKGKCPYCNKFAVEKLEDAEKLIQDSIGSSTNEILSSSGIEIIE